MRRRGFTLTEILIVIALIVLMLGLAVPAFNLVRGSRSVDGAENQVAAMLGRARADAIGLQQPHGIMFFIDPQTDRTSVAEVYAADYLNAGAPTRDVYLDLVPDVDFIALPPGVLAFTLCNGTVVNGVRQSDGYIGYNNTFSGGGTGIFVGGLVLFNGDGQLISRTYGYSTQSNGKATAMQFLISGNFKAYSGGGSPTGVGSAAPFVDPGSKAFAAGAGPSSAFGFALCDRDAFKTAGTPEDPLFTGAAYGSPGELDEEKWLDDNSSQSIINRYNGTLTRAE
jgi:prepilin-type N-terminal cleavage/methylation domain-containing protein